MINKEILLLEKKRYNLPLQITQKELTLLALDMPVQKIIGYIEMQGVKIFLKEKVLIPRYETEEVILKALEYINSDSSVLDLCCGSGFIGIAIAKKISAKVTLSDIDKYAILQSQYNAKFNQVNVEIIKSDLFENIKQKFDIIVSNPPYIPKHVKLPKSIINHEPLNALYANEDGNYFYKKIIKEAKKFLNKNDLLIFEISEWNLNFFQKIIGIEIFKDINNKHRIAILRYQYLSNN